MPQTVALLGSYPPLRAISSYCSELAHALAQQQPVEFISFKKIYPAFLYPGGKLEEDHSFPDTAPVNLRVQRRLTWYNPFTWLKAALFTRAELLHAQWWSLPLLPIYLVIASGFRLRGKPVVITIHNVVSHERSAWYTRLSGWLYRLAQHFIVHSEQNRQQLMELYGIASERISVVPHGPLELFNQGQCQPAEARQLLGLDDDAQWILLFGAVRPYKGIDTALEALALISTQLPQARLLIAGKLWGDWQEYARLIDRLKLQDRVVTHLDYIPTEQVGCYFQAADLVLLPYHHFDSQSGIGSAALAFEKPLIVTDTGGLPELVDDAAQVVPPKDPEALAAAISLALRDKNRLQRMRAGAARIRERSSWPRIAQQTSRIYADISTRMER